MEESFTISGPSLCSDCWNANYSSPRRWEVFILLPLEDGAFSRTRSSVS